METMAYDNIHIYAKSAALTVEGVQTENRQGYTIRFEAARRLPDSKNYDWNDKLAIQVTLREFPDVMACLLGHLEKVEFTFHGEQNNKGYRILPNKQGLLIELFSKAQGKIQVPALPSDRFTLTAQALRNFQRNYGGISSESLLEIIASSYKLPISVQ